jgi:hypothetical protein
MDKISVAFCLLLLASGSAHARLPVPDSLSAAPKLAVEGRKFLKRNPTLRFGDFRTAEMDRSRATADELNVAIWAGGRARQGVLFTLLAGDEVHRHVSCASHARKGGLEGRSWEVGLHESAELECRLVDGRDIDDIWRLTLSGKGKSPLSGALSGSGGRFVVRGTRAVTRGLRPATATGYYFNRGERTVAAVEVLHPGAVWFDEELGEPERGVLAAASAALLLLEDLRSTLDD